MDDLNVQQKIVSSSRGLIWIIVALVVSVVFLMFNNEPTIIAATIWEKAVVIIISTILGYIGAVIGNVFRRFVAPTMVLSSGGFFALLWTRVFWTIGPQAIGCLIGIFSGAGLSIEYILKA